MADQKKKGKLAKKESIPGVPNELQPGEHDIAAHKLLKDASTLPDFRPMSQRNRVPRDRARGTAQDAAGEESQLWNEIQDKRNQLAKYEVRAKEVKQEILDMESKFKERETQGTKPSPAELDALDVLYREEVRITEHEKALLQEDDIVGKLQILIGLVKHTEEQSARVSNSRDSHPRPATDFDGPSDSPVPSPAENKHVRKIGAGRTSSQPPREKETSKDAVEPSEPSSNPSRTKITFSLGAEVAFKPKIQNQTEEHDWIQGTVVKVIGEGKSRRYDVQDPFPDDPSKSGVTYRSSASSMVPIPPVGTPLGPYEVGKQVLALYPETTTFYRAEVKAMLENGSKVQLLFEDEAQGALKVVDRRVVLDHKG